MISGQKIAANRRNAQRSTGPTTEQGRRASSRNAVTHGFYCSGVVVQGEDETAYQSLAAALQQDVSPQTTIDALAVEQLAGAAWRLRRFRRMEAKLLDEALGERRRAYEAHYSPQRAWQVMTSENGQPAPSPVLPAEDRLLAEALYHGNAIDKLLKLTRAESTVRRDYRHAFDHLKACTLENQNAPEPEPACETNPPFAHSSPSLPEPGTEPADYRITFGWSGENAHDVDFEDYH